MNAQDIVRYFSFGVEEFLKRKIGMEVETQFVTEVGVPISTEQSQAVLSNLSRNGWRVECRKGNMITALRDKVGNQIFYELGRHNMEVSTVATTRDCVVSRACECLEQIYSSGRKAGAYPYFAPILPGDEDLLVVPDERDATWLSLDGRMSLMSLARTSSVQFTVDISVSEAIPMLNRLGERIEDFLRDYPQEWVWREYIWKSRAGYREDRYGGPLVFDSLEDYCEKLSAHDVVCGPHLVPFEDAGEVDIPLFIRSVWWCFRLKRYGPSLCIEVRPLPRREDELFGQQLELVLGAMGI